MKSKLFRIIIACAFTSLVAGCGKYEMAPSVEETINTTVEIEQVEEPAVTVAVEEAEPEPELTVEVVDDAWKDAYVNFITKAAADVNAGKYELGSDWPQSYYVYDVTGDETPELFIKCGSCEADYNDKVYAYTGSDELEYLGVIWSGHSAMYSNPNGGMLRNTGHMGYASIESITYVNGDFVSELIMEESGYDDDGNFKEDFEYTDPADVVSGAKYLEYYELNQTEYVGNYLK